MRATKLSMLCVWGCCVHQFVATGCANWTSVATRSRAPAPPAVSPIVTSFLQVRLRAVPVVLVPVLLTFGCDACVACPVGPRGTPCNGAGTCISGVNGQGQCQCFPESGFMGTRRGSSGGVPGAIVVSPAVWLLRPQATTVVPADPAGRPGAHQVAARTSAKAISSSHCHSPRSSLVPESPVASRRGWALCCSVLVPWSGCACWCSS